MNESRHKFTAQGPRGKAVAAWGGVAKLRLENGVMKVELDELPWRVTLNGEWHESCATRDDAVQMARELAGTVVMR